MSLFVLRYFCNNFNLSLANPEKTALEKKKIKLLQLLKKAIRTKNEKISSNNNNKKREECS